MTPAEREELKRERAGLKELLFGWRYGNIPKEQWPKDVQKMEERFEEVTKLLQNAPLTTVTGRMSSAEPHYQPLPPRSQMAKEIVESFRKSHQPAIDSLDIDYGKLELMVLASLTQEEIDKLKKEVYPSDE